jgi:hypothetical protein
MVTGIWCLQKDALPIRLYPIFILVNTRSEASDKQRNSIIYNEVVAQGVTGNYMHALFVWYIGYEWIWKDL